MLSHLHPSHPMQSPATSATLHTWLAISCLPQTHLLSFSPSAIFPPPESRAEVLHEQSAAELSTISKLKNDIYLCAGICLRKSHMFMHTHTSSFSNWFAFSNLARSCSYSEALFTFSSLASSLSLVRVSILACSRKSYYIVCRNVLTLYIVSHNFDRCRSIAVSLVRTMFTIINPRRACAARVTVVVLCVCLFVCQHLFSHYRLRGGL